MSEAAQLSEPLTSVVLPTGPLGDEIVRANVLKRFEAFLRDPETHTEGLWPHQAEAVVDFAVHGSNMVEGKEPNQGMSPLHATGAGKTKTLSKITAIVCQPLPDVTYQPRALWFVPNRGIERQTLHSQGRGSVSPITQEAPGITVDRHVPRRRKDIPIVTVMAYQALVGAIERGDIAAIDPLLMIADENHHIIDGAWAEAISSIHAGRLLVGATASEGYSQARTIRKIFPVALGQEQGMRKSINEGILCELRGYLHRGKSRIVITRPDSKNFSPEDLFDAIANSADNYTAAKICVGEVSQGRKGIIRCVPGGNRLHPKIMASILNKTEVEVDGKKRLIQAASIDGSMGKNEIDEIFSKYKAGEIDVVTFVSAIGEGWNSPETEFLIDMDATTSPVKVQQPMGRIVRHYEDKTRHKIATLHQFVYEVAGSLRQVLFTDILDEDFLVQGRSYRRSQAARQAAGGTSSYDPEQFLRVSGLADSLAELDNRPVSEIRIASGQEKVPANWPSSFRLSQLLDMPAAEVRELLDGMHVLSQTVADEQYYPPGSATRLATALGLEGVKEDEMTEGELVNYYHGHRHYPTRITRSRIAEAMPTAPAQRFANGRVVKTYPTADRDLPLKAALRRRVKLVAADDPADKSMDSVFAYIFSSNNGQAPRYPAAE